MPDPARELARLLELRDLAAYRSVSAIQTVLDFWEAQDFESAYAQLQRARAEFQCADAHINDFYETHFQPRPPKGETHHGNRSAA